MGTLKECLPLRAPQLRRLERFVLRRPLSISPEVRLILP